MEQRFVTALLSFVDFFRDFAQIYLLHFFFFLNAVLPGQIVLLLVEEPRKLPEFVGGLLVLVLLQLVSLLFGFGNAGVDGRRLLGVLVI